MNTDLSKRVPWKVARDYTFGASHWLRFVGELEQGEDKKQWWTVKIHAIRKDGTLVCKCDFHPANTDVYTPKGVDPKHRHLLCKTSKTYLRHIVTGLTEK